VHSASSFRQHCHSSYGVQMVTMYESGLLTPIYPVPAEQKNSFPSKSLYHSSSLNTNRRHEFKSRRGRPSFSNTRLGPDYTRHCFHNEDKKEIAARSRFVSSWVREGQVVCMERGRKSLFYSTLKHGKLRGRGNNIHADKSYRSGIRVNLAVRLYLCPHYPSPAERDQHDHDDYHSHGERDHDDHHYVPAWDAAL